jgi:Cof subfamily protein (haloacid dehalogenase superfamily)
VENKIVFVDFDGTLAPEWGSVSAVVRQALAQARRNGHAVYLSTGRTAIELSELASGIEHDGVVGAGGGFVRLGSEIVWRRCFDPARVVEISRRLTADGIDHYLQTDHALLASAEVIANLPRRIFSRLPPDVPEDVRQQLERFIGWFHQPGADRLDQVYKFGFFGGHGLSRAELVARYGQWVDVLDAIIPLLGSDSGELLQPGVSKATAMSWLLDRLGVDPGDTIAIGDSGNDVEMLQLAGVGIAMGNATANLLAVADEVTGSVAEDGVAQALLRHGLV